MFGAPLGAVTSWGKSFVDSLVGAADLSLERLLRPREDVLHLLFLRLRRLRTGDHQHQSCAR